MEILKKQEPAAVGAEAGSNSKSGPTHSEPVLPISVSFVKNAITTETEVIDVSTLVDGIRNGKWAREVARVRAAHATGGTAEMLPFDLMTIFRTPYRIDIVQPVYFVIESFAQLAASLDADVGAMIDEAKRMGDLPARFEKAA